LTFLSSFQLLFRDLLGSCQKFLSFSYEQGFAVYDVFEELRVSFIAVEDVGSDNVVYSPEKVALGNSLSFEAFKCTISEKIIWAGTLRNAMTPTEKKYWIAKRSFSTLRENRPEKELTKRPLFVWQHNVTNLDITRNLTDKCRILVEMISERPFTYFVMSVSI
jgi:hypothetical protein